MSPNEFLARVLRRVTYCFVFLATCVSADLPHKHEPGVNIAPVDVTLPEFIQNHQGYALDSHIGMDTDGDLRLSQTEYFAGIEVGPLSSLSSLDDFDNARYELCVDRQITASSWVTSWSEIRDGVSSTDPRGITRGEIKVFARTAAIENFSEYDLNGNRVISREELTAAASQERIDARSYRRVLRRIARTCERVELAWIGGAGGGGTEPTGPVDITDAIFVDTNPDCAAYANTYAASVSDISRSLGFGGSVTITATADSCALATNAIPNHDFNDTGRFATDVAEVNRTFTISRAPLAAPARTSLTQASYDAVMRNGVVLDLLSAGCYRPNSPQANADGNVNVGCNTNSAWLLDPMSPINSFGTDSHNAHTQPDGTYHYHGDPNAMFDDSPGANGSPVIGFAADGFPIYGSYFRDPQTSTVRKAVSGYQLKSGTRPSSATDPGGAYSGMYIDDYEFAGTGDLDECNGMTIGGVYGYYVTDTYPWVVGCLTGTPDASFRKSQNAQNDPLNVLLIIADDLGVDVSSQYPYSTLTPPTPTIDAMAANGIVFDNAWATPACTTTRGATISGQHGFESGITFVPAVMSSQTQTIQQYLGAAGATSNSQTGIFGKWHITGPNASAGDPGSFGVDNYAGNLFNLDNYNIWELTENGQQSNVQDYHTSVITDKAIDWIQQQNNSWFAWVAYYAPHTPFHVPPSELLTEMAGVNQNSSNKDKYFAMIEAMDTEIGRLLQGIPDDERENTIVIYIGDNGTPRGMIDTSVFDQSHSKGSLYEGGIRVPFVVYGSRLARQRLREDTLVNVTDLFSTIATLMGAASPPAGGPGRVRTNSYNFSDLLMSEDAVYTRRPYNYAEWLDRSDDSVSGWTVRDETYKYIRFDDGTEEFYDISGSLAESANLINDAALQQRISTLRTWGENLRANSP